MAGVDVLSTILKHAVNADYAAYTSLFGPAKDPATSPYRYRIRVEVAIAEMKPCVDIEHQIRPA